MASRCFLCRRKEEAIDHFLLHCDVTRVLWDILFSLFGVHWVFPNSVVQTLEGWRGSFIGKKRKEVWRVGPLCLFGLNGQQETKLLLKTQCCPSRS